MKFYEVQEQWNNLHWNTLAYFKKEPDAEKYVEERSSHYPIKIIEREFSKIKRPKKS